MFFFGGMLSVMIILTLWDEDVAQVEHLVGIMAILGVVVIAAR